MNLYHIKSLINQTEIYISYKDLGLRYNPKKFERDEKEQKRKEEKIDFNYIKNSQIGASSFTPG